MKRNEVLQLVLLFFGLSKKYTDEHGGGITVDTEISETSTHPVQNKVIKAALDLKVNAVNGKGLSTEDYTSAEKNKLSGIESGANKTVIDSSLISESTNPVQNKAVKAALDLKANASSLSGKLDKDQGVVHAGKFLVVGDDGKVAPKTLTEWQGGTY